MVKVAARPSSARNDGKKGLGQRWRFWWGAGGWGIGGAGQEDGKDIEDGDNSEDLGLLIDDGHTSASVFTHGLHYGGQSGIGPYGAHGATHDPFCLDL